MKKINRNKRNTKSMLEGDAPLAVLGGVPVRPVSLQSLVICDLIGNPFAAVFGGGGKVDDVIRQKYALAEFLWVHSAPEEQVKTLALQYDYQPDAVREAVLAHAATVSLADMEKVVRAIFGEVDAVQKAEVSVLPDDRGNPSKNALSRPWVSRLFTTWRARRVGQKKNS